MKIVRPITIDDDILISTDVPETDHAAYSAATTYALGNRVIVVATHKIYESLQNANLNKYPPDNLTGVTPWWLEVSATNAWQMFDSVVGQQTVKAGGITVSLDSSNINNLTLMNLDATSLEVTITDNTGPTEVYSEVFDLVNASSVVDLYTYFFEPFYYTKNITVDIPIYPDATVDVAISNSITTSKCGELVLGNSLYLGCTQFGSNIGITDYSVKQVDDFGNYSILQRAFSKRGSFDFLAANSQLESVINTLTEFRSTPAIWVPTDQEHLRSPLLIYGFYKDFNIVIQYATESSCSIEIEGLI